MHGGLSILVADDRECAEETALLIRRWGHRVEQAHDGIAAIDEARRTKPDLMFVGLALPGLNGLGVAQKVFQTPELNGVQIAVLLANSQEVSWRELKKAGFCERLVKPVAPLELLSAIAKIREALGRSQQAARAAKAAAIRHKDAVRSAQRELDRHTLLGKLPGLPLDHSSSEICATTANSLALLVKLVDKRSLDRAQLAIASKVLRSGEATLSGPETREYAQLQRAYLTPICKLCHYWIPREEVVDSWSNGGYCNRCHEAMK
ncbi:MAG TPA: response regulator [Pirellulales bacterium]|nr:response regulator [Pirellulales bacterium]